MTLKNKFDKNVKYNEYGIDSKECEKIADNYAIEFVEWKDNNCIYYDGWNIKIPLGDKYDDVYTNRELLEIFKKEKGL